MDDTMRAIVIASYGASLESTVRPLPRAGKGEVLVRVRASGLCSTDLHLLSGRQPLGELPRIVGHELAGDVVEVGEGVGDWQPGDRVTAAIDVTCGRCRHCLAGETQRCRAMRRIGFERDGGHADYAAVPAANLVAVPAEIPYAAAAILPDAVACMYHSLVHQGAVGIGQRVLIMGVGGLGIHGVQIAKSAGAEVFATSRRAQRLELAECYGAVGIDTSRSVRDGLGVLAPGGKFLVVAYVDETFEVPSLPLFKTEQQIIGCRGSTKQDLIDVVDLVRRGQVTPILGASYSLDEIGQAAARLESGDLVGRIWLTRD